MRFCPATPALLLVLALLVSAGHSQSKPPSARQHKQAFVYDLDGMDVRLSRVEKAGTLKPVAFNYSHDDVNVGRQPLCIVAAPNGRALYVSSNVDLNDNHSGQIIQFAIQKNGRLTRLGSVGAGVYPQVLAMTRSGSFLYCSAEDGATGQGVVYQYRIERNRALSPLKPPLVNVGKVPFHSLAIAPSEKYLYMPTGGKPVCFRISRSGALLRLPTPPTQANPTELALSPSGKYAYLLKRGVVSAAAIDPRTGRFSSPRPVAHILPASCNMSVSPHGILQITRLQIAAHYAVTSGPVSEFHILPTGDLKPSVPPTFSAAMAYRRLAPDPRGGFVSVRRSP